VRSIVAGWLFWVAVGISVGQQPVKLDIQMEGSSVRAGEQVPIRVRLLSAANQAVQAPKRLEVLIQARQRSGEVKPLRTVTLDAGQSEKEIAIAPPGSEMVYIWAKNAELLPGGAYVAVRTAGTDNVKTQTAAPPPQQYAPPNIPIPTRPPSEKRLPTSIRPPVLFAPPPAAVGAVPAPRVMPKLALRYSPDRRFLADGKDSATVQAFLLNESSDSDIRLNLYDSSGSMDPIPLTIPKGQDSGRAAIRFNQPGSVTVEFMGSNPPAEVDGDRKLQIPFMPPITHATLEASPPAISLVDRTDLVITLRDAGERPVASDAVRHVTFAIQSGRGNLTQTEIDIPAGQSEARTTFEPAWMGQAAISAATPNLLSVSIPLQVSMPLGLLLCSVAGGLAGGYFSYLKQKRSGGRRIVIGVVTGFIFYWACLFLGLAAIGHGVVVNPLSAFALSAFGGWLQTDVFSLWKKRLKAV
jgi:hypothetical protein